VGERLKQKLEAAGVRLEAGRPGPRSQPCEADAPAHEQLDFLTG
jgi:hypothetical protein